MNLGNDVTECAQVQEREETSEETAHDGITKQIFRKPHGQAAAIDKNKEKLNSELKMNRVKKNAGSMKEARERRKLVCEKSNNSERYPLAAERVVSEFKLRRAGGARFQSFG